MKKFMLAAFCTVALVGYVAADEFLAVITKVDGSNVSYFKAEAGKGGGKGGKKGGGGGGATKTGDEIKGTAASSVKVFKSAKDDSGDVKEMEVKEGLKADNFMNIGDKGVTATVTVADDGPDKGKITKIVTKGGKKKGG
jgi:hypothetical protein